MIEASSTPTKYIFVTGGEVPSLGEGIAAASLGRLLVERGGSRAAEIYGASEISERRRHRYEVNNSYRDSLIENGLAVSGTSADGNPVEVIELKEHPWFLGTQFHPELKSRPNHPHPLFSSFIGAALAHRDGALSTARTDATLAEIAG